jgi:outer membrane protein OmpA-like peptidoglycan-associated protein
MLMFPSTKAGSARRMGLAIGVASTLLTAPGAFAQTATDIIRDLAPIDGGQAPPPPGLRPAPPPTGGLRPPPMGGMPPPDMPPMGGLPPPDMPPMGGLPPPDMPPPPMGGLPPPGSDRAPPFGGPRIEDTDVFFDGRRSHAYIDYSRAIDLTVYFDYNSSRVGDRARDMLDRLGEALSSPQLRGYRFLIAGHTDGVGSDEANLELSYKRAEAVREYLWRVHKISRHRLAVKGWGRNRLKDQANPESGINRRVEVALIVDRGGPLQDDPNGQDTNRFRGARPWFTCPPGSHLIDPQRPDLNIDDFGAGATNPMCRPD